ncbi:MAG: methyltransferase domain-containing protein [Anaerolineae bacterium]|nr:methyltransferase domain-containing protein [Anaerolineae bacterium]
MNTKAFANTRVGQVFIRIMAAIMESRLRYRFFGPGRILQGADLQPGQTVLEIGCGTGFFTLPAARLLGDQGSLVAMDVLPMSVEAVTRKVQSANLKNVRVVQGDALNTKLAAKSVDAILIFGVIPAPMLPMDQLLSEMQRILKPGGTLSVWPPSWVQRTIVQSRYFALRGKRHGVSNYERS